MNPFVRPSCCATVRSKIVLSLLSQYSELDYEENKYEVWLFDKQ